MRREKRVERKGKGGKRDKGRDGPDRSDVREVLLGSEGEQELQRFKIKRGKVSPTRLEAFTSHESKRET